jgi:pantoate--beta-alanine ligase
MGSLHEGHLALVDAAHQRADSVWVSIFVNPTQFGPGEDFDRYPRPLDRDLDLCRARDVDVVFAPHADQLYSPDDQTWVDVTELTRSLCGASRPGHFRGVTTVVAKLLLAAKPHVAVFGEKDYQQLAVIRRMVRDLGFDDEIAGIPTVREPDGLALSSRNQHLDADARQEARVLVRALDAAERAVGDGVTAVAEIENRVRAELAQAPRATVDYAELRDPDSLEASPAELDGPALLALAVCFPTRGGNTVRLIDNRILYPQSENRP